MLKVMFVFLGMQAATALITCWFLRGSYCSDEDIEVILDE